MKTQQIEQGQQDNNEERTVALAKQAQRAIYTDQNVYTALVTALQNENQQTAKTIGLAAANLIEKMEETIGEVDIDILEEVALVVVAEMLELAKKAGAINEVSQEVFQDSLGEAYAVWMRKHPDRINRAEIEELINSPEGQEILQNKGLHSEQQPAQQLAQQPQNTGLIDGVQ